MLQRIVKKYTIRCFYLGEYKNMRMDLDRFILYTKNNFLPKSAPQEKAGRGEKRWSADNWTLGVAECLMAGIDNYKDDKMPYSLYYRDIIVAAKFKMLLAENLEKLKDRADSIFVAEVGRGLDILVANSIKKWKNIYCYDQIDYEKYLKECFGDEIKFTEEKSAYFKESNIKEECIMIMLIIYKIVRTSNDT